MSHIVKVPGKSRATIGTASARRMRSQGLVPGIVYGHKQDPANIVLDDEVISGLVKSGVRVVDLEVDGNVEKALLKDVQWDTFSTHIVHVDFLRVDVNERVRLDVPLQLKGTAPGVVAGGVLEITHHTVTVECLAVQLPDFIQVRIGSLNIGEAVHVSDLQDVPQGVTIVTPPETVLLHIVQPKGDGEAAPAAEAEAAK